MNTAHRLSTAIVVMTLLAMSASAGLVASYDAGVSPTAGTTGATDPATMGWTASTASPGGYNYGADSTNGGWRITDGTSGGNFFYEQTIPSAAAAAMASNDWTASWTTAVNADAVSSSGVPSGVDNYYNAPNHSRQNDNGMWIELASGTRYILIFNVDGNDDIQIDDGTNTFQITTANNQLSQELGTGAPLANYVTFTLTSIGGGTPILTDSLGGNHGTVATSGTGATDRVVWGAYSSPGQGSTTWNNVSVTVIPEPSSFALVGLALVGLVALRRRR